MSFDPTRGIAGLKGALRYVRAYREQIFVLKLGGDVLRQAEALENVVTQVALLVSLGVRIVIVHGGGPQVSALSQRLGLAPNIVAGRRVTDAATLEVVKQVLGGQLNIDVLAALRAQHVLAIGLSGIDGGLITARRRPPINVVDDQGQIRSRCDDA